MSRVLAWCFGATIGLFAGWLLGNVNRDYAEMQHLARAHAWDDSDIVDDPRLDDVL